MLDRELLIHELRRDEGFRSLPYHDTVGKLTIGIGRNLSDVGLSEEEAIFLLENDIDGCIKDLDNTLSWWGALSPNRKRALINMCFNLGINRLLGFEKMLKAMRNSNFREAAKQALNSKWAKQVGTRAERIANMIKEG